MNSYSKKDLAFLVSAYLVSTDGLNPKNLDKDQLIDLINIWLQPENEILNENAYIAVSEGVAFDPQRTDLIELAQKIFGENYYSTSIGSRILETLAIYPAKLVFDNSFSKLYKKAANIMIEENEEKRNELFTSYTKQNSDLFLNDIEKIFYLLHGYGLPNKNISLKDYEIRQFLISCKIQPTAITILSEFTRMCPTNFSARDIYNKLSDFTLTNIPKTSLEAMKKVVEVLNDPQDTMKKFEALLISYGMFPYGEYNRMERVYETNLSQLNDYSGVIIDRRFSLSEIVGKASLFTKMYIMTLSDLEILRIKITLNNNFTIKFTDYISLNTFPERERKVVVQKAVDFLTEYRYFVLRSSNKTEISYGRFIDAQQKIISLNELMKLLKTNGCLYAIGPLSTQQAKELITNVSNSEFQELIEKLLEKYELYRLRNSNYISTIDGNELAVYFSKTLLNSELMPKEAKKLAMYSFTTNEYVSLTFEEYFANMYPQNKNLLNDSITYYSNILSIN